MEKPLLKQFIEEKIKEYKEPLRQGTPKGDPIGFSKVKFKASLLMLTNRMQKDIAKELGISHGLLRKWGTEEAFKNTVADHRNEYASKYIEHVYKKFSEGEWLINIPEEGFPIGFDEEIEKAELDMIGFKQCRDSNLYSIDLASTIISRTFSSHISKILDLDNAMKAKLPYSEATITGVIYRLPIAVLAAYRYSWADPPLPRMGAEEQKLIRKVSKELKKMVTEILRGSGKKSNAQRIDDDTLSVQFLFVEERMNI